jgi:hypothetical protein
LDGYETLFWLEVESGNASRDTLQKKMVHRLNQALIYSRRSRVRLVFALLSPPWVLNAVRLWQEVPKDAAILVEDWRVFGMLPFPEWGKVR